jgi:hypothetical protein
MICTQERATGEALKATPPAFNNYLLKRLKTFQPIVTASIKTPTVMAALTGPVALVSEVMRDEAVAEKSIASMLCNLHVTGFLGQMPPYIKPTNTADKNLRKQGLEIQKTPIDGIDRQPDTQTESDPMNKERVENR